jgi:penicillin-binding protein 1A
LAEQAIERQLAGPGTERNVGQGALISMTSDGAVRAMVGGRSYAESQFNRATQALRQPGSAFKLFVYLAGLENGLDPDDRFQDAPVRIGDWSPSNYADRYYGEVTLREAYARSLNSVAVRVTQEVGHKRVISAARRLGITSDLQSDASISLGTSEVTAVELTGAYASIANGGRGVLPHGLLEIRTKQGEVLWRRSGGGPGRIVAPLAVKEMTDLLRANVVWGTGKAAQPGERPAAGKTGTSQDFRDAWFVGFTAELVTGIWFGNDDGAPMQGVTGGSLPARAWRDYTVVALQDEPARPLPGFGLEVAERDSGLGGFIGRILENLGAGGDGRPQQGNAQGNEQGSDSQRGQPLETSTRGIGN